MIAVLRNRPLLLAGAVLLPVGALTWWISTGTAAAPKPQRPAIPVSVGTVQMQDVPRWASGIGTVQSLHTVTLRPQVEGVLAEVLFREGQTVSKGDLLARIDDREFTAALMQAQAEQARTEAQLKTAELDLARYSSLLGEEAISQQTVEQQSATVDQLKAALRASQALVAAAQVQHSYTRITAPVSGRIGLRRVDAGNLVRTGDADGLVTVTQMNPISVIFTLPQEQLGSVRHLLDGSAAPVVAYDRDGGTALAQGQLAVIDNEIDAGTGMVRLRAEFTNADGSLWPGQFVTVRLQTGISNGALVLPAQSVRLGLNGSYVYRVRDQHAEVVAVTPTYQDDRIAIVSGGVAAGDSVVTDGYSQLKDGSAVKTQQAAGALAAAEKKS